MAEQCSKSSGGVVGKLQSTLAADDLHALGGRELLARGAELVRARNRMDAELVRAVRACEQTQASELDGLTSMQAWLRGHARLPPAATPRRAGATSITCSHGSPTRARRRWRTRRCCANGTTPRPTTGSASSDHRTAEAHQVVGPAL
jgi:hypothetical protein